MTTYICLECNEEFGYLSSCVSHSYMLEHELFELPGIDKKITIKSHLDL